MSAKKTIFIIPGYKHNPRSIAYKQIAKTFKKQGFYTVPVTIPWKQTTITENKKFFLKKFRKMNRKRKYIFGFSFGAMIAFLASTEVKVSGLILCSLSPYFKEDVAKIKKNKKSLMQTLRFEDFSQLECSELVKKIKANQILMSYGSKEAKSLINRVNEVFAKSPAVQKFLFPVDQTEHNIADKKYLSKITQMTQVLQ